MLSEKYHLLRTFCSVVHFGSFSKAAAFLRLPVSSVSKHVKQLEAELNTQLIIRNTRSMKLTDAGTLCHEKGSRILKNIDDMEHEIHALSSDKGGKLRVSLPLMIGEHILSPILSEFSLQNPNIQLELYFSHLPSDLIEEDFDIAFRTASDLPDSNLFEVKLMALQSIYVASPHYIKKMGNPTKLSDLVNHNRIEFKASVDIAMTSVEPGAVHRTSAKVVSNSHRSIITAACKGIGIASVYDVLVRAELADKSLIQVLKDDLPNKRFLSMLYRQKGNSSEKINSFIEFFRSHPNLRIQ